MGGVGLILNSLAAWIFFRVPSDSGMVVYLKNMVLADLLMLLTIPWRVASEFGLGGWQMRVIVCRYSAVVFYSSMYVGIVLMGLISLERYVKVVGHSCSCTHLLQRVGFAWILALLTWGLLLFSMLPNVVMTSKPADEESSRKCVNLKTQLGMKWHEVSSCFSVALFWATFLLMAFCYISISRHFYKSYRRVNQDKSNVYSKSNRSIFSLLAVFFVCFVPYHVCRVPYTLSQLQDYTHTSRYILFQMKELTLCLAALNVCLDPIIYFLMCTRFRESLLKKLPLAESGLGLRSFTMEQSVSNI
ncbi:P2Y purinoceptor 14 isoform X2 [Esox lucius]|nr:P2Y purinoceptor 14 isoform X2 [Esox lucius]